MDRPLQRGRRGDLESQTALSCPSGTGDGHEPHIGPLEKLPDACKRIGSTHEPVVEGAGLDVSEICMWGYTVFLIPFPGGFGRFIIALPWVTSLRMAQPGG